MDINMVSKAQLNQLNLITSDMAAAIAFYRRLGLDVEDKHPFAAHHVAIKMPNGFLLEIDSVEFVKRWNPGWHAEPGSSRNVVGFGLPSREAVDRLYEQLVQAGYRGQHGPHDAFWGARYAIVEDPDGNSVGLMSPIDPARKSQEAFRTIAQGLVSSQT
jgi:catechol 2,3-dioxygenase-like lactoylglutathione lyase family enzyme